MKVNRDVQIPIDFECRPALSKHDFLVTSVNSNAIKWVDKWPDWPSPVLCISGPAGCGKSHLAEVFKTRTGAKDIKPGNLNEDFLLTRNLEFVFEDADSKLFPISEEVLLHLYNHIKGKNGHILITAKKPPSKWNIRLQDLSSRLNTAVVARIGRPDDVLMSAIIFKMFSDRQLLVTSEVINFAVKHMERSFLAAQTLVVWADKMGLSEKRKITIPLVKKVIKQMEREGCKEWT